MNKANLAYIVGVAMGDGNLSNPNGRAVRLRVTCDDKYPCLIKKICNSIKILMPKNKVSLVKRKINCTDISCYSNKWENYLGWKAKNGSKEKQKISIPSWIIEDKNYTIACLRGLFETDGSIYKDRGYLMVNFTTIIENLATDVFQLVKAIGYAPNLYKAVQINGKTKYVIRVSRNAEDFIKKLNIQKS